MLGHPLLDAHTVRRRSTGWPSPEPVSRQIEGEGICVLYDRPSARHFRTAFSVDITPTSYVLLIPGQPQERKSFLMVFSTGTYLSTFHRTMASAPTMIATSAGTARSYTISSRD
jgi:hypothetical protein